MKLEKGKFNQIINNQSIGYKKAIKEINLHITQRNFDKALEIIGSLINKIENTGWYVNDDKCEYYCFDNAFEEIIFKEIFKPEKEIIQIPEKYGEIYFSCGNILFEIKKFNEAKIYLEKAVGYNPINTKYLFELGEIYKMRKVWDIFLRINRNCLKFAYTGKAIARCYRNFGYYFFEEEKYDVAAALYYLSIFFDREDMVAHAELNFITNKTGIGAECPDLKSIKKMLKENDIQFGANDLILTIAYSIGLEAHKKNNYEVAEYLYNIVFELTSDKEVKKLIDQLHIDNK